MLKFSLIKLIVCPAVMLLSGYIFLGVYYPSFYQPVLTGLLLAASTHMMDALFLKKGTLWLSTLSDLLLSIIIIYFVSLLFPGAYVTVLGAVYASILLSITEFVQHLLAIKAHEKERV